MSFFAELKRRNVFRVGIAYAVTSWLLIQVTDILFESIGAPPWVMQAMFVVLAAGFVIALFFAWAFELTPDGVKKEKDVDRTASISPKTGQKMNKTIVALLLIAVAYIAYDKLLDKGPEPLSQGSAVQVVGNSDEERALTPSAQATPLVEPAPETAQKSIVVLPFVNMSNDPDQEFFSDGLSEELLNVLAQIKDLRVISRTSAFAFKGKDVSIPEIAAALNVSHVLEGSVRRSGDDIRITAQLIEVATDSHLWSDAYNRKLENIFEIQEEIAGAITQELQVTLGTSGKSGNPTDNLEAYQLYLRGRNLYQRRENIPDAVELLQQAVDLDHKFTEGWANLGAVAQLGSFWSDEDYREYRTRSKAALQRALSLDPDNGLAHAVLGMHYQHELRWEEALKELDLAIALNPNESNSLLYKGEVLVMLGYTREAIKVMQQAEIVDPVFANVQIWLIGALITAGEYELAQQHVTKLSELNPADGHEAQADITLSQGDIARAESLTIEVAPNNPNWVTIQTSYFEALKDPAKTESTVNFLIENQEMTEWQGIFGMLINLGEIDAAIGYWNSLRARERLSRSGNYLSYLWNLSNQKMSDPQFIQFLEDTGIADYWRKHGNPDNCRVAGETIECGGL
jgi:TolB-like protein/Tfp pilus assembly protein PilF